MKQENNRFRLLDDNALQRDSRRTDSSKGPPDKLPLVTRHEIFFRKVEDQKSPKSLPGDNNQKHWDLKQQNKVTEEQQKNDDTDDESLTQARIEHIAQAKTDRREEFAGTIDSAEIPKTEPSAGGYWETVKSLAGKSLTQLAKETAGWAWQTLSDKNLPQRAKETVEWTWQNGVKSLSAKKLMRLMVMYLALSAPYTANAVKIYGKNGCSIDSRLSIDMFPLGYGNARRIVEERFEQTFPKLVERYAKNPCDKKYEKIRVTFDPNLRGRLGYVELEQPTGLARVFLQPIESKHTEFHMTLGPIALHVESKPEFHITLGSIALHEFSHIVHDFIMSPPERDLKTFVWQTLTKSIYRTEEVNSPCRWLEEATANYNTYIYGTKHDTQHWPVPPNLRPFDDYARIKFSDPRIGSFLLWLDKKFPGFVDKSSRMAQEKYISWKDLEKLTNGQSLEKLWRKYKKIDFATEMSPFIEEQRQKYLGRDQQKIVSSQNFGKRKTDPLARSWTEAPSPPDRQQFSQSIEKRPPTTSSRSDSRSNGNVGMGIVALALFAFMMRQIGRRADEENQFIERQRRQRYR